MTQTVLQATANDLQSDYQALRQGVGILELPAGKLQLSGKNAIQFLNGLVSNDVKTLPPGGGVLAAFPTLQGKLLALARIYQTGEHLLLELDAANREKIFKNLSRFVPAGDFFVQDVSDTLTLLTLQGPRAAALLAAVSGQEIATDKLHLLPMQIAGQTVHAAPHRRCGDAGIDLFVAAESTAQVKEALLAQASEFGARFIGEAAFEIARIEAGVPREGVDAGENYIILESELNDAVSYTKGCYLGQEVIARIHWRGQPAKRLRGLLLETNAVAPAGTEVIAADGKKVGEITSSTHSPALNRFIALAYIHRYYLTSGTEFTLQHDGAEIGRAQLTELPFVGASDKAPANDLAQ